MYLLSSYSVTLILTTTYFLSQYHVITVKTEWNCWYKPTHSHCSPDDTNKKQQHLLSQSQASLLLYVMQVEMNESEEAVLVLIMINTEGDKEKEAETLCKYHLGLRSWIWK